MEGLAEGTYRGIAAAFRDLGYRKVRLQQQLTGIVNPYLANVLLKGAIQHLLELMADIRQAVKIFGANFGQGNILGKMSIHIFFDNIDDGILFGANIFIKGLQGDQNDQGQGVIHHLVPLMHIFA